MIFSERYGFKKVREKIQIDSMDIPLRNSLWNLLTEFYWKYADDDSPQGEALYDLSRYLWSDFFTEPLDEMDDYLEDFISTQVKDKYYNLKWNEVYDFIEFISQNFSYEKTNNAFRKSCNDTLEKELSAYRFVDNQITRITNSEEIESIEKAIEESNDQVCAHLSRALELLSDRKSPDYRNSIKESISAVESLVQKVIGKKGTLGQLLEKIEEHFELHKALKDSFKKLYGYTSDEDGIRHAMLEESKLDFDDAKFMLLTCSAFINYVRGKLEKS